MKALVVSYSKFGNTQAIAEVVAETLQATGTARVLHLEQLSVVELEGIDLLVMGVPTHKMNLPEAVAPILKTLPKGSLEGVSFAAFDTSYQMSWFLNHFTASKKLNRRLRKLGGKPIVPPEIFLVTGKEGPLFDGEIERAKAWTQTILDHVQHPN